MKKFYQVEPGETYFDEEMVTYLEPEFDSRKSFYNKAVVKIEGNKKTLYSYNVKICSIVDNVFHKHGKIWK